VLYNVSIKKPLSFFARVEDTESFEKKFLINLVKKGSFFKHNKCLIITLTMNPADESVRIEEKTTNTNGWSAQNEKMCLAVNNEKTIDRNHKTISYSVKTQEFGDPRG
jgi:hypothetical protein